MPKMTGFLYENHWGSPTLTLLNMLGVLNVLNILNRLNVLNVLYMPMDASLACWALDESKLAFSVIVVVIVVVICFAGSE